MQKLIEHISELLYLHDCVIIPDFGGFICNESCAVINEKSGIILPPTKAILFNRNLIHNDGLLLNWIACKENISYEKAETRLTLFCEELKVKLHQKERITFGKIGMFYMDRHFHIIFEPSEHNFFAETYGMGAIHLPLWTEATISQATQTPCINLEPSSSTIHRFLKYGLAAAAIAGIALMTQLDIYPQAKEQWHKIIHQSSMQPALSIHSSIHSSATCNSVISPEQDYVDYDPLIDFGK